MKNGVVDELEFELGLRDVEVDRISVERPASMIVVEMLSSLVPVKNVVIATGLSEPVVLRIKRVNQRAITENIRQRFANPYEARLEREIPATLDLLLEMRDKATTPDSLRVKICVELLNRAKGIPTAAQKVEKEVASEDPKKEFEDLQKRVIANANRLGANVKTSTDAVAKTRN